MFEFTKVDGLPRVQRRSSRRTVANDEWLTGCFLAHPTMAKARVLRRREQSIAHGSALTATSPLDRVLLDCSHVVFPRFKVDAMHRSAESTRCVIIRLGIYHFLRARGSET